MSMEEPTDQSAKLPAVQSAPRPWHFGTLFLLGFLVHVRSLSNAFAFDDLIHIVENARLRSWELIFTATVEPSFPGNLVRPFSVFLNGALFQLFALDPLPYHVVNVMLHGTIVCLIFALLRPILAHRVAWFAAASFAVLPVHSEAVANITGRNELVATLFGLISLLLYRSKVHVAWVGFAALLAVCSKESMIILPLLCLIAAGKAAIRDQRMYLGLMVPLAAFLIFRWMVLGTLGLGGPPSFIDNPLISLSWLERSYAGLLLLGRYAVVSIVPFQLSADHSFNHLGSCFDNSSILSGGYFVLSIAILCAAWSRQQAVSFGARWFLAAFLLTANIIFPIGTAFGERLSYTPSIGLMVIAAATFLRSNGFWRWSSLALPYTALCWMQDGVWRDNRTLHSHQISVSPNSAKTQLNYAVLLRNDGRFDEADYYARRALKIVPCYADAMSLVGSVYLLKGLRSGGEHWLNKALRCDPTHIPSLNQIGRLKFNNNDLASAQEIFQNVLKHHPGDVDASIGLLGIAIARKEIATAHRWLQYLHKVVPNSEEVKQLAAALGRPATPD
jgi:protein O-mannosyl-transferase